MPFKKFPRLAKLVEAKFEKFKYEHDASGKIMRAVSVHLLETMLAKTNKVEQAKTNNHNLFMANQAIQKYKRDEKVTVAEYKKILKALIAITPAFIKNPKKMSELRHDIRQALLSTIEMRPPEFRRLVALSAEKEIHISDKGVAFSIKALIDMSLINIKEILGSRADEYSADLETIHREVMKKIGQATS